MAMADGVKGKLDGGNKSGSVESDSFSRREISDAERMSADPRDASLFEKKFSGERNSGGGESQSDGRFQRGEFKHSSGVDYKLPGEWKGPSSGTTGTTGTGLPAVGGDGSSGARSPWGEFKHSGGVDHKLPGEWKGPSSGPAGTTGTGLPRVGGGSSSVRPQWEGLKPHGEGQSPLRGEWKSPVHGEPRQPVSPLREPKSDLEAYRKHPGSSDNRGKSPVDGEKSPVNGKSPATDVTPLKPGRTPLHGGTVGNLPQSDGVRQGGGRGAHFVPRVADDGANQQRNKIFDDRNQGAVDDRNRADDGSRGVHGMSGNAILDTIQMRHIDPLSVEAAGIIKNLGVQVAEKIIATYEALNAKQEVRMTLQDSVLKSTEVVISKNGGQLNVTFLTGSEESANILNYRSGDLRTQLMERLADVNNVEVEVEHQNASDNQNSDGRSQNRFGGDQQQGEEDSEQQ
jgi:type III secretion system needle length determinant